MSDTGFWNSIDACSSRTLRNSIIRRKDFIKNDYDQAVVEKILMVLINSEGLAKKRFGEPSVEDAAEEDQDANLQKEQTAEEEVMKEQVSRHRGRFENHLCRYVSHPFLRRK
jgi:hypothetical protein